MKMADIDRKFLGKARERTVQWYEKQHQEGLITASQKDTLIQGYDDFYFRVKLVDDGDNYVCHRDVVGDDTFVGAVVFEVPDDHRILLVMVMPDEKGEYAIKTLDMTTSEANDISSMLEYVISRSERARGIERATGKTPTPKRSGKRPRRK